MFSAYKTWIANAIYVLLFNKKKWKKTYILSCGSPESHFARSSCDAYNYWLGVWVVPLVGDNVMFTDLVNHLDAVDDVADVLCVLS